MLGNVELQSRPHTTARRPETPLVSRLPARWMGNAWHFACLTVFQLLVLRQAGAVLGAEYGQFGHLFATSACASAFTFLGLPATVMRLLARHASCGDYQALWRIILGAVTIRMLATAVVGGFLWLHLRSGSGAVSATVAAAVCLFFAVQALALVAHAVLQGLGLYGALAAGSTIMPAAALLPATDLGGLFRMLSLGLGAAFLVHAGLLARGLRRWRWNAGGASGETPSLPPPRLREIVMFSLALSIAGLFTIAADNLPILLLDGAYSAAVYSVIALSFQLALYPARFNAFSESLVVPQISAAAVKPNPGSAIHRYRDWSRLLRVAGPGLMLPIALFLEPFVDLFFAPELRPAAFITSILLLGVVARMTIPAPLGVIVARGRPGALVYASGVKLLFDLAWIVCLRGYSPIVLAAACTLSWLLYANVLHLVALRMLGRPSRPELVLTSTAGGSLLVLLIVKSPHILAVALAVVLAALLGAASAARRRAAREFAERPASDEP